MAEVLCPKCGKPNPGDLENCQFCQSRLQSSDGEEFIQPGDSPVRMNTSEFEKTRVHSDEETIRPGQLPTKKNTSDLEQVLPSWLRAARGSGDVEQPSEEESAPTRDELSATEPVAESVGEEIPDWLTGLGTETALGDKEEVPDWLANLREESGAAGLYSKDESLPASDLFSEALSAEPEGTPAEPETAGSDLPDWLSGLKSEGQNFLETPLDDAGSHIEPEPSQADGVIPDWLAGLKPEEQRFSETVETQPSETETSAKPGKPRQAEENEIPDWLAGFKSAGRNFSERSEETPRFPEMPSEFQPAPSDGELPDWLASIKPEEQDSTGVGETTPGDLPDWTSGIQDEKEIPAQATAGKLETPSPVQEEMPDWLSGLQARADQAESKPAGESVFEYEPAELSASGAEPSEALPDWLEGIPAAGKSSDNKPALIASSEKIKAGKQPKDDFSMETPDWLSTLKPEEKATKSTSAFVQENVPGESLEPGELPSWVQAMRPVESAVSDVKPLETDEQIIESQGPLAGLSGVLPAGPGLGSLRKPPAYSIKLHANESQQRHAAHLEQMVAAEGQAAKVARSNGIRSTHILRWVIAAILLLAVGFPTILGSQSVPAFWGYPSEMGPTINQVDALPVNPPVLIVFDYQPAFVGEMNAAAGPLIDYLIITKGARLAMVSTIPTGPALAEWFMKSTQAVHGYQAGQQYINLGYISGGTAGVISFIQDPATATPVLFNQASAWSLPPLDGVQSLGDFSMLVILTDSADTARVWVEQAAQYMDTKPPMVMVVSAQAEPMIRPYFDADQIQGLVVGLTGGKSLEAITRPGLGRAYWDAFSYGLLVAEVLILVGGIWSALSGIRSRRMELNEGEA